MDSDVSEEPAASAHAYVRSSDLTDLFYCTNLLWLIRWLLKADPAGPATKFTIGTLQRSWTQKHASERSLIIRTG